MGVQFILGQRGVFRVLPGSRRVLLYQEVQSPEAPCDELNPFSALPAQLSTLYRLELRVLSTCPNLRVIQN
jgi:hypothetical protein